MNQWYQLLFIASAVIVAFASDLAARQKGNGDSGAFWSRVCKWTCLGLGSFLLLITPALHASSSLASYAPGNSTSWLFIVFSVWLVLLCLGLVLPIRVPAGRWLAGSAGFSRRRFWIAGFAIVFLPAFYAGLETWPEPNDAANWALAALLTITLLYTSFSVPAKKQAQTVPSETVKPETASSKTPADWIQVMRAAGIDIETLHTMAPEASKQATGAALQWQQQLESMGCYGVAP